MSEEAKVYVVTSGDYSDYHVLGVFTDQAKAEALVAWRNGPDKDHDPCEETRIEEYALNEPAPEQTGAFVASGNVTKVIEGGAWVRWDHEKDPSTPASYDRLGGTYFASREGSVCGYGKTPEHAKRSAREMARAIKAGTVVPTEDGYGHQRATMDLSDTPTHTVD